MLHILKVFQPGFKWYFKRTLFEICLFDRKHKVCFKSCKHVAFCQQKENQHKLSWAESISWVNALGILVKNNRAKTLLSKRHWNVFTVRISVTGWISATRGVSLGVLIIHLNYFIYKLEQTSYTPDLTRSAHATPCQSQLFYHDIII